ncbi:MAG: hypothetical protein AB1758_05835 [Candidatus Eremiobacterota bacterium]
MVIQAPGSSIVGRAPLRAVSRAVPASPTDTVELQGGPQSARQLLWTSLESAQLMSGEAVPGPIGLAMTAAQKNGVLEVLRGIQRQDGQLREDRGFWAGLLGQRRVPCTPERALQVILEEGPEFDPPLRVRKDRQVWDIGNLADLRDASALCGNEPLHPAGPALKRLRSAGWKLEVRQDYSEYRQVDDLEAYRTVTRGNPERRGTSREKELRLTPPPGHSFASETIWADADMLPSVDFFYGSGDPDGLADPELARGLKALQGEGLSLECSTSACLGERSLDACAWYSAAVQGESLKLVEHRVEVAEFKPTDLEALRAEHGRWTRLDQGLFQPAVQAGLVPERDLDDLVKMVARPVAGHSLEERARMLLDIVSADRTKEFSDSWRLYDDLADLGLAGPDFAREAARAAAMARSVGSDEARKAVDFLLKELPGMVPLEPARQRLEQGYLRLLQSGADARTSEKCLELARTQVDGSPFEARIDELARLRGAGARQEGYQGLQADYQVILEHRRSGENLTDAARPMVVLLEALSAVGQAEQARDTYAYIRQGLEFGLLTGSEEELLQRFLQTLLLRPDPEEARTSLARPATATAPGSVQETPDHVKVGGVVIPRKRGS